MTTRNILENAEMPPARIRISIGLVVYNGAAHIRNALNSIVNQSYDNIELIVVDGGSADGTLKILQEYAPHISVQVSEPDKGIYDAMNKVCALATGDWLIFQGCDDLLRDSFADAVAKLKKKSTIYYGDVIHKSNGKVFGGKFSKFRLMQHNISHQAMFYPKSVYKQYSYNLKYPLFADYAYNLTLIGAGVPLEYIGIVVAMFNDKGRSINGDPAFSRDQIRLIREAFGNSFALLEVLRRVCMGLMDRCAKCAGWVLKRLLPEQVWKALQGNWRRFRNGG